MRDRHPFATTDRRSLKALQADMEFIIRWLADKKHQHRIGLRNGRFLKPQYVSLAERHFITPRVLVVSCRRIRRRLDKLKKGN